ncbi:transcriptional regulator [Clostridium sp. JN-1]|jgi:tetratricopeptide (TPR) repeat protein|uniref:transcriptional regulator n=1 Tax=Clostridium sp. JN-1 TaxID=2483110 RepID=UPI000F0B973F|nr:transcriptional regulator [Clostridium sp. JN-1]
MEILSTGQKIKRARIYKGYTLKRLCSNRISVSKMSCIENDKVVPEKWVLDFIAKRLEIDGDYLKQDVKYQITQNINNIKNSGYSNHYEKDLSYNLKFAEKYHYYDICLNIMHFLFNYYLEKGKTEKIQLIISKYYDYCHKCFNKENEIIYYMDIAKFFYTTKEFSQAASYYNNVRIISNDMKNYELLSRATYNEAACYLMLEDYEKSYSIAEKMITLIDYMEDDSKKAEAYHMLAILSLRKNSGKFEEYEKKSYELYKDDLVHKSQAMYNYGAVMFALGLKKRAVKYVSSAIESYPKDDKMNLVKFLLMSIKKLIENDVLEIAQDTCDTALNYAIDLDNVVFIEMAYHYKALILEKQGKMDLAEMYMNLSLDALLKFANSSQICNRYIEMGDMYHKMGDVRESIKYFNLGIQMEKRI